MKDFDCPVDKSAAEKLKLISIFEMDSVEHIIKKFCCWGWRGRYYIQGRSKT